MTSYVYSANILIQTVVKGRILVDSEAILSFASSLGPLLAQIGARWGERVLDASAESMGDSLLVQAKTIVQKLVRRSDEAANPELSSAIEHVIRDPDSATGVQQLEMQFKAFLLLDQSLVADLQPAVERFAKGVKADASVSNDFRGSHIDKLIQIQTQINYGPTSF